MKQYYLYKLTNTINGKYYIGVHKTSNFNDSYYGSGTTIRRAIAKYGKEAFTKTMLLETMNETEAYLAEKNIIGNKWSTDPQCYNNTEGGRGGFSHIDNSGENNPMKDPEVVKRVISKTQEGGYWESKEHKAAQAAATKAATLARTGSKDSQEIKDKRNASLKAAYQRPEVRAKHHAAMVAKRDKYKLIDPSGVEQIVDNLCEWCNTNKMPLSTITTKDEGQMVKRGVMKGWKIWKMAK
tara:strand:+ start:3169 stop:3885 length:717 start_codon:yes stop_codon:yes gene_type:complete